MPTLQDILSGAAAVPQAIGGGALDILIGDRTNVTAGEQAKRAIQALLLGGDHGENLLALQQLNARGDLANYKSVASPQFQETFNQLRANGVPDQDAYSQAARLYGISGFQPTSAPVTNRPATDQLDAAIGAAGGAPTGRVPLSQPETRITLPPVSATDQVKYLKAQTQVGAMSAPDPLERVRARYEAAGLTPPTAIMRALSERQLPEARAGVQQRNLTFNPDGSISAAVQDLPLNQRFYTQDAVGEAQADLDIALTNQQAMKLGIPDRLVKAYGPEGIGVQKVVDPFVGPLAQKAVAEFSETGDPRVFEIYGRVAQPNAGPHVAAGGGDALDQAIAGAAPSTAAGAPSTAAPLAYKFKQERDTEERIRREKASEQSKLRLNTQKLAQKQAADLTVAATKAKGDEDFITAVLQPIEALIPQLPDTEYRGLAGAATSAGRKVQRGVGEYLETDPLALQAGVLANTIVTNVGRRFGEKGVFTDQDAARFLKGLDIAASSQEGAQIKVDSLKTLMRQISERAKAQAKGRPIPLAPGETLIPSDQFLAAVQARASETGTPGAAPNPQPTPSNGVDPDLAAVIARRRGR